jgi:hypothetical protein
MSLWLMALHLLNFMLPAIGLALLLGLSETIFNKKRPLALSAIGSVAIYFFMALAVLLLGLALLGRDGKVLTYTALTLLLALLAAWRHR